MSKKRDCYDIFSGSRDEEEFLKFIKKPLIEQWKELYNEAVLNQSMFVEPLILIGVENNFCDKNGKITI